jgi:catechol 2,3-dioxygenase-like lactoylglutathione lyase family enzyme
MMRLSKLSYLTLWAVHFDKVKALYKETLGLPVAQENENFIMFDTKGSRLAFHRLTEAPPLSRSTVEVHLEVNDVDEVYSSLRSKGVKFDDPPANRPWGTRSAGFKDPEGYVVEIVGPLKQGEPTKGN